MTTTPAGTTADEWRQNEQHRLSTIDHGAVEPPQVHLDALPDEAQEYANANPRPGQTLPMQTLMREDFRLRKVPAGWRVAQRIGGGWETLATVYESRTDAHRFIARAVGDEPPFM